VSPDDAQGRWTLVEVEVGLSYGPLYRNEDRHFIVLEPAEDQTLTAQGSFVPSGDCPLRPDSGIGGFTFPPMQSGS
jgi:hypothetical protein